MITKETIQTIQTKVIALDVYGTILDSEDEENEMPSRQGFEEFVKRAKDLGLILVAASDQPPESVKEHLQLAFRKSKDSKGLRLTLDIFDRFYQFPTIPKDFSQILHDYQILPKQLFVIGDQFKRDIEGAEALGCLTLHVPEYGRIPYNFDFSDVKIP